MHRKRLFFEIFVSVIFVFVGTFFAYSYLAGEKSFWQAQSFWSAALAICWVVVASGYYHQGWLIRKKRRADDVSILLPIAVFFVQCFLFVKGVYYGDWSLIWGAVVVNSGVVFSFSQILQYHQPKKAGQ